MPGSNKSTSATKPNSHVQWRYTPFRQRDKASKLFRIATSLFPWRTPCLRPDPMFNENNAKTTSLGPLMLQYTKQNATFFNLAAPQKNQGRAFHTPHREQLIAHTTKCDGCPCNPMFL